MNRKAKPQAPIAPGKLDGMAFEPGDEANIFPGGQRAFVLTHYALHPYTDRDDVARVAWGYLVRAEGSTDASFAPAWMLRDRMDKPSHIKLVGSAVPKSDRIDELNARLAEILAQATPKPKGRK